MGSKQPQTEKCTEFCTIKHIMSTLYKCDVHGEFYYWPKLTNEDVTWLEKSFSTSTNEGEA